MHPYEKFVSEYAELYRQGRKLSLGGFPSAPKPVVAQDASTVLIFSPHPDDECIIGALPLRLLREARMRVINVAVTQGSKKERQMERLSELQKACEFMGYELIQTKPNGLEKVNPKTRQSDPAYWNEMVRIVADIVKGATPRIVFFPHQNDWNSSHMG